MCAEGAGPGPEQDLPSLSQQTPSLVLPLSEMLLDSPSVNAKKLGKHLSLLPMLPQFGVSSLKCPGVTHLVPVNTLGDSLTWTPPPPRGPCAVSSHLLVNLIHAGVPHRGPVSTPSFSLLHPSSPLCSSPHPRSCSFCFTAFSSPSESPGSHTDSPEGEER